MSNSIIGTSILTLPLSIDASKITTGTLATTVVPDLDASKITTGTLDTARVDATGILTATNRTITAGNGLSGGGTLAANRTITLGTPSSITSTSANSVTSTSHTHSISSATIGALNTGLAYGAIGSYAILCRTAGRILQGSNYAGSGLFPAGFERASAIGVDGANSAGITRGGAAVGGGSWRAMGRQNAYPTDTSQTAATLFLRIS